MEINNRFINLIKSIEALEPNDEIGLSPESVAAEAKELREVVFQALGYGKTAGTMQEEYDRVNRPKHYTSGGIECIDAMEAAYGTEAVMHFCQCNAFKYQWRFNLKNGTEDIEKAIWYQKKYIELDNKLKAK